MASPALQIVPLLTGSAVWGIGSGVIYTLLPLRLAQLGYSNDAIGFVVTGAAVGFLLGCLTAARLIRSVGHVRCYAACAAIAATTTLGLDWADQLWMFVVLKLCTGLAAAGVTVVTESWLNEFASNERRGRLLTVYILVTGGFYGVGQLIARDLDVMSSRMLMLCAGFYALSLVPVTALRVESPKPPKSLDFHLLKAFKVSPVGTMSCLHTGLVSATFGGIGALFGQSIGLPQATIVLCMAAVQIGGLALQWPLGFLSDHLDRRYVLLGMLGGLTAVALGLSVIDAATPLWVLLLLFSAFGGLGETFYPIGVAHANDRADPSEYVSVSSNLLLVWSFGSMVGPIAGTAALEHGGPRAFFWYVIALCVALALYTLWRIVRRARIDARTSLEEFVAYPTTSPAVYEWVPHHPLKPGAQKGETPQGPGD